MLYRKYDFEKRSNFIISDKDFEDLKNLENDIERIKIILEQKYRKEIMDAPPYHFFVNKNGVFEVKSTELAHNDNTFFKSFNDDIRILLLGDKSLLITMADEISECIAKVSAKYAMKITNNIIYVNSKNSEEDKIIKNIEKLSIKKRHKINPVTMIYEAVVDDEIIINEKIVALSNRHSFNRLKLYSDRFSIPLNVLRDLNTHVDEEALKISDIIFVPAVIAITGKLKAMNCKKHSEFIYNKCRYLANKEALIDG